MSGALAGTGASLRARLLVALIAVIGVVWILVGTLTYRDAQRELDSLLDAHLAQSARLLVTQSAHEIEEVDVDDVEELAPYQQKAIFQVWGRGRELLLKSADAPVTRLSPVEQGLSDAWTGSIHWRVYSAWDRRHRVLVQIAEDHAVRDRLATRIAFNTTLPLLLSLPLLALAIGWAVARALRPVVALGQEVDRRQPLALEPITVANVPKEIAPLVERLNSLFARVQRSFEQERRFTANAAHELRNPLAALRVQAEVARTAGDALRTHAALDQVILACDRLTRLISQLLMLARVDEAETARAPCDLVSIAREVIAELAPAALEANQEIALDSAERVEIAANRDLLIAMLRNLIDNALRHGGSPLRVRVSIAQNRDAAVVSVVDDGKGIPAEAIETVGTRFYRPEGTQADGSGLGLALVRRIAEWHGGTLEVTRGDAARGARITVTLPT